MAEVVQTFDSLRRNITEVQPEFTDDPMAFFVVFSNLLWILPFIWAATRRLEVHMFGAVVAALFSVVVHGFRLFLPPEENWENLYFWWSVDSATARWWYILVVSHACWGPRRERNCVLYLQCLCIVGFGVVAAFTGLERYNPWLRTTADVLAALAGFVMLAYYRAYKHYNVHVFVAAVFLFAIAAPFAGFKSGMHGFWHICVISAGMCLYMGRDVFMDHLLPRFSAVDE